MQRSSTLMAALTGMLMLGGCAPPAASGLTDADRAAMAAAAVSMATAANSGQIDAWGAFLTESAEQLPPNSDIVVGRTAVLAVLKSFPPMSGVRFIQDEVEGSGELAYVKGRYEMTLNPPGAPPISDRGKYIEIWRKQADGRWLIDRDMYSSSVPIPQPKP